MSERKINLEEILKENLNLYIQYWLSKAEYRKEFIINAMKEAVKQALELAAENVEFIETTTEELNSKGYMPFITAVDRTMWTYDKQSILDTINQIE